MHRVAVVGATGYAGAELVRLLLGHPEVTLTTLTSRQFAGKPFAAIYPTLAGCTDLVCAPSPESLTISMMCCETVSTSADFAAGIAVADVTVMAIPQYPTAMI